MKCMCVLLANDCVVVSGLCFRCAFACVRVSVLKDGAVICL